MHIPIWRPSFYSHLWNLLSGSKELHIIVFSICVVLELISLSKLLLYLLSLLSLYTSVHAMGMWEGAQYSAGGWQCLAHRRGHGLLLYAKLHHVLGSSMALLKKNVLGQGQAGSWQSFPVIWAGPQKLCARGRQKSWVSLHFFRCFLGKGEPAS